MADSKSRDHQSDLHHATGLDQTFPIHRNRDRGQAAANIGHEDHKWRAFERPQVPQNAPRSQVAPTRRFRPIATVIAARPQRT